MKKITILLLAFLSISTITKSQTIRNSTLDDFYSMKIISNITGNNFDISSIQGSPYLNNNFQPGDILTTSNTNYIGIPLRYNIYNDEMEYKGEDGNTFCLEKSTIKSVVIGSTEFFYKAYSIKNSIGRSFFEVLNKGTLTLLKKYHVRFEEEQPAKPFADPTPAKFHSLKSDFFIVIGEQEARRVSSYKELFEILPDKKSEIEKFTKSNKLKIGNQEDLIKIIAFYNSELE